MMEFDGCGVLRIRGAERPALLHCAWMQQRGADQIRRVSRSELSHRLGAMAFEGSRADAHSQRALLVGATLADEVQNLALAPGQGFLAGLRRKHDVRRPLLGAAGPRLPS